MDTALSKAPSSDRWKVLVGAIFRACSNPWSLFFALLLLNSLARPYSDLIHDARLYAVQVMDRTHPGLYSDDLYLRYGSQDKYSLFSYLVSPSVKQFGLQPTFFVFYLCSNALMILAAQRLVLAVAGQRLVAVLALVYFAVNPVVFAGLDVFHVNESFLTPRLLAIAFVFFALERLVRGWRWSSLLLLVGSLLMHPIMGFSGFLVWIWITLTSFWTERRVVAVSLAGGLTLLLIVFAFPSATTILGYMDPTWRRHVFDANFYATPSQWELKDWLRIVTAFGIVSTARNVLRCPPRIGRLLDAVLIVATLGVVGGVVAAALPYALLIQGQPYRALWLLQFIQLPLLFAICRHGWLRGEAGEKSWAALLAVMFACGAMTTTQLMSTAGLLLLSVFARGAFRQQADADSESSHRTILIVGSIACVMPLLTPLVASWDTLKSLPSPLDFFRFVPPAIGPALTFLMALVILAGLSHRFGGSRRFRIIALAGFLIVQTSFVTASHLPLWGGEISSHNQNIAALRDFLKQKYGDSDRLPTIYWPRSQLDDVWIKLPGKSFFTKQQASGNMFHRATAIEHHRRAQLVRAFELAEVARRQPNPENWGVRSMVKVLGGYPDSVTPTREDLYRVCREECDVIVTHEKFDGLYSTQIGPLFVYECDKVLEHVDGSG